MQTIRDLLERDLDKKIEEIIKVNQTDEQTVYEELTEYIVTKNIRDHYTSTLDAIAKGPQSHTKEESVGVWISGFFGSGKSSFAKNLGYVLANPTVCGRKASEVFKQQVNDHRISEYIDLINRAIPTEVIMFDISVDRSVKRGGTERIAEILYRKLLMHFNYAEDFDIAELEIELEAEERFEDFLSQFNELYPNTTWEKARTGAQKMARTSATLHKLDPVTYPDASTWSISVGNKHVDFTVNDFVNRVFELSAKRAPGKALVFIIDELGQYVARSGDKIEDLRAVVEQLGKQSKNRLKERQILAPVWLIVTSQEKLQEVVAAIDDRNVQLAKLQDRFKYKVDLSPADIREVATKRVLSKKPEARPLLSEMFQQYEGRLTAQCSLERATIRCDIGEEEFIQFYPYLPHFIELSIKIMSGIRLQPGATRHLGGSNRTIIKQSYEMLVSDRTKLADKPIGTLVTLDKIYELVEGNLASEKRSDITDIAKTFSDEPEDNGWALQVAKSICLLEFVRELPRTEKNIAAVLVDGVGQEAPIIEVKAALARLSNSKFIKNTEEGYKLQSAEEKNWSENRQKHLDPRPADRIAIRREIVADVLSDPRLKAFRFGDMKSFKVGYSVDGAKVGDPGAIQVLIETAESPEEFSTVQLRVQEESREKDHQNDIFWVFALTPDIDRTIAEYHASNRMISSYDHLASQNKITHIERECLDAEKRDRNRLKSRLSEKIAQALLQGTGVFQGVQKDGSALGDSLHETFSTLFDYAVPYLFPKLEMGAVRLKGNEAELVLTEANLNGLPAVFYDGESGLELVKREGQKYVPNTAAETAREILLYLHRQKEYGERVTGKDLEEHFQGFGYGWDRDLLRLVLAVLFRAGTIAVTHQGKSYTSYQEAQSRMAFTNNPAFRSAGFAERVGKPELPDLVRAADLYEEITGEEVDIDEAKIVAAFKDLASRDYGLVVSLKALIESNRLPVEEEISEYHNQVEYIRGSDAEDTFSLISTSGRSFAELRQRFLALSRAITPDLVTEVQRARSILTDVVPIIKERCGDSNRDIDKTASRLHDLLLSPEFAEQRNELTRVTGILVDVYDGCYRELHKKRASVYSEAIDAVRAEPDFEDLTKDEKTAVLSSLERVKCIDYSFNETFWACSSCRANLGQMQSDIDAVEARKQEALSDIQVLVLRKIYDHGPDEALTKGRIIRLRITNHLPKRLERREDIEEALVQLREELYKLIDEGHIVLPE